MDDILQCVIDYRNNSEHTELELRIGSHTGHSFTAGVNKDVFTQFEQDLLDSSLQADHHWSEVVDYHYTTSRNERARTRVEFDSEHMEVKKTHICKAPRRNVLLRHSEQVENTEVCRLAVSDNCHF